MKVTIDKTAKTLTVVLPLADTPTPSASGKTLVVASSHGNQPTTAEVDGRPVMVGCNAYIKPVVV